MMKQCPKCGCRDFSVTLTVTQTWDVDEVGRLLRCTDDCKEVTHLPDDDDIWACKRCGHSARGALFTTHAPMGIPMEENYVKAWNETGVKTERMVTEWCSHCEREVRFPWDLARNGHEAKCPQCGNSIFLCNRCRRDPNCSNTDYDADTGLCKCSFRKKYPELSKYDESNEFWLEMEPTSKCERHLDVIGIHFEVEGRCYSCFTMTRNVIEALCVFFAAHQHITYDMLVEASDYSRGFSTSFGHKHRNHKKEE